MAIIVSAVEMAKPYANRTFLVDTIILGYDALSSLTLNRKALRS
jgi:hypothetical protein